MKTQHTQGPWYIDSELPPNTNSVIIRTTYTNIAISANIPASDVDNIEDKANAKLIAAAPELLNCLFEMTNHLQGMDSNNNVVLRIPLSLSEQIGEVIKKATS